MTQPPSFITVTASPAAGPSSGLAARLVASCRRALPAIGLAVAAHLLAAPWAAGQRPTPPPTPTPTPPLSMGRQVPMLIKVLNYDRRLESKVGAEVVIGIVYSGADRNAETALEPLSAAFDRLAGKPVKGLPMRYWWIPYVTPDHLASEVKAKHVDVFYVCAGLDVELPEIITLARALRMTTLAGNPDYVKAGLAVGVGNRSGKPQILINMEAAKAERSDYMASLLQIAEVVR